VLLWTAEQSSPLGPYPGPVTSFLTEAATSAAAGGDTAPYGGSLLTAFPAGGDTLTSGTEVARGAITSDPAIVTISGADQVIDPGVGNHTIQFLSADTLVLHANSVDQVSGFDPMTDILDAGALLSGANVSLNGDSAALGNYLTIVDQGADALLRFDPTGHGGGRTVAMLQGLGSSVTGLNMLIAHGAIGIS
jgi:hypothetical protein